MGKLEAKQLNDKLTLLKSSNTKNQAVEDFKKILSEYEEKYPYFIKYTVSAKTYHLEKREIRYRLHGKKHGGRDDEEI